MTAVALEPRRGLLDLIEAHKAAKIAFEIECDKVDCVKLGREPSKAAMRRYDRANDVEEHTLLAVCSYQSRNDGDHHAKAEYLLEFEKRNQLLEEHIRAILTSMLRKGTAMTGAACGHRGYLG